MTSIQSFVLPVEGTWKVLTPPGHGRHGRDLMAALPDGRFFAGTGLAWATKALPVDRFFGWEQPVHSPTEGEVIRATDGIRDRLSSNLFLAITRGFVWTPLRYRNDPSAMAGNHVIIETAIGFVLLAHLRCGSVTVQEGETVAPGRQVGQVGNSGNSVAPHLHLHLSKRSDGNEILPLPAVAFVEKQHDAWIPKRAATLPSSGLIHALAAAPRLLALGE